MDFLFRLMILVVAVVAVSSQISTSGTPNVSVPECSNAEMDIVFLLDSSTSVTDPNFGLLKDFVKSFLQQVDIDGGKARVGVIAFNHDPHISFRLDNFTKNAEVSNAVDGIQFLGGASETSNALQVMREDLFNASTGDRPGVGNVAVLMTDGDSDHPNETLKEAQDARNEGITIYSIGIGVSNSSELNDISSPPVIKTRFDAQNFTELMDLRKRVFSAVCAALTQSYATTPGIVKTAAPTGVLTTASIVNTHQNTTVTEDDTHQNTTVTEDDTNQNTTDTDNGDTQHAGKSTSKLANKTGVIVGATLGALALVALGVTFGIYRYRKSRLQVQPQKTPSENELDGHQTPI